MLPDGRSLSADVRLQLVSNRFDVTRSKFVRQRHAALALPATGNEWNRLLSVLLAEDGSIQREDGGEEESSVSHPIHCRSRMQGGEADLANRNTEYLIRDIARSLALKYHADWRGWYDYPGRRQFRQWAAERVRQHPAQGQPTRAHCRLRLAAPRGGARPCRFAGKSVCPKYLPCGRSSMWPPPWVSSSGRYLTRSTSRPTLQAFPPCFSYKGRLIRQGACERRTVARLWITCWCNSWRLVQEWGHQWGGCRRRSRKQHARHLRLGS